MRSTLLTLCLALTTPTLFSGAFLSKETLRRENHAADLRIFHLNDTKDLSYNEACSLRTFLMDVVDHLDTLKCHKECNNFLDTLIKEMADCVNDPVKKLKHELAIEAKKTLASKNIFTVQKMLLAKHGDLNAQIKNHILEVAFYG